MRRIPRTGTASRYAVTAAAAVVAALGVAGCAQTQLGAAALYSNQRISSTKLAAEVANLNAAYQKYKNKLSISYTPADMPRQVLSWMLRFATADRLAAQRGIVVTPAQAQHEIAVETANVQQAGDTLPEAAVLNGLPPDMLPQLGTWISIQVQLTNQLDHGITPKTTAGSNALTSAVTHLTCVAAKSLRIKVNPQYGVYDYAQFLVVVQPNKLAKPPTGGLPPVVPRLTPPC